MMALIKCQECGHTYSDQATACPKCGCPNQIQVEKEIKATNHLIDQSIFSFSLKRRIQVMVLTFLIMIPLMKPAFENGHILSMFVAFFVWSFFIWLIQIFYRIGSSLFGIVGGILGIVIIPLALSTLLEPIFSAVLGFLPEVIADIILLIILGCWFVWFYIYPIVQAIRLKRKENELWKDEN